tara:strand:+ start:321 stop:749 length:429 start_codon:yes stop_codon:yes gene_type:complete
MSELLYVKKFADDAVLPIRKSTDAAGYDLSSNEDVSIEPGKWKLIKTDIGFTVPKNTYGQIANRSGLSCKGVMVGAGIIDRDYTGEVKVLLFNLNSENQLEIKKHDRIAQLIIKKISTPEVQEVYDLELTDRGDGGFGSTGN